MDETKQNKTNIGSTNNSARDVRYFCPYCKEIMKANLKDIGVVKACHSCEKESIVPKRKLSIKGELPTAAKTQDLEADKKVKATLSLSGEGEDIKSVIISDPEPPLGPTTPSGHPKPLFPKWMKVTAIAVLGFSLLSALVARTDFFDRPPSTAEEAKPSEEVIFSMIDVALQLLQKAETSNEIRDSDILTLVMLRNAGGEGKDAELLQASIDKRNHSIRQDLDMAAETIAELTISHHKWEAYIEDLFAQKLSQAKSVAKMHKADWLEAILHTVREAPDEEQAALIYIQERIKL